jgi:hypothetical protein
MAGKLSDECEARTLRIHIPTYNYILEFFRRSPDGISGAQAIRKLLYEFGLWCKEQLEGGEEASFDDLSNLGLFVKKAMGQGGKPTDTKSTNK